MYRLLLLTTRYEVAYSVGFIAGLVGGYLLNVYFVFRERASICTFFAYPAVYVIPYFAGLVLLKMFVDVAGIDARWAPFAVLLINVPLTFLLTRALLRNQRLRREEKR